MARDPRSNSSSSVRGDAALDASARFGLEKQRPRGASTPGAMTDLMRSEGAEGRAVWFVLNNGGDGDDWRLNNVVTGGAGAIGRKLPWTAELEAEVRRVAAALPGA